MCKLKEFFAKITGLALFFLSAFPIQAFSQLSSFPYEQGFESAFAAGKNVEFLPFWWGNEVSSGSSRIYRAGEADAYSGSGALAAVPTGSFTPQLRLFLDATAMEAGELSFWARSGKNGSGSRTAVLTVSFSGDGGEIFGHEQIVGAAEGFANTNSDYQLYELPVPEEVLNSQEAVVKFTVSRGREGEGTAAKVFLDNIYIQEEVPQFKLLRAGATEKDEVLLWFNRELDRSSAENRANYQLNEGAKVLAAKIDPADPRQLRLSTSTLEPGTSYKVKLGKVLDAEGNSAEGQEQGFVFEDSYTLQIYDLLISEIHAAPNENTLLPNVEWVEIYNASGRTLKLAGVRFADEGRSAALPPLMLEAGAYLLLAPAEDADQLESYGRVAGLSSWPSLNNSGDVLSLYSAEGRLLDRLAYEQNWYGSSSKAQGGWSLERIDLSVPCAGATNWFASGATAGGTPGQLNSIAADKPDLRGPELVQAFFTDTETVQLIFNEPLDTTLLVPSQFSFSPFVPLQSVTPVEGQLQRLLIRLGEGVSPDTDYQLNISNLTDCSGNLIQADRSSAEVVFPLAASAGDVVINEVMYDPATNSEEWIEIANASVNYLNLQNWQLATYSRGIKNTAVLSRDYLIIPPSGFLVFSRDPEGVKAAFPAVPPDRLIQVNGLPQLANTGDTLVLINEEGALADKFAYSRNLHSPFVREPKGVSLERIYVAGPGSEQSNWTSAAAGAGFGTPGEPNSQRSVGMGRGENLLEVEPEVILPGGNGRADYAAIHFKADRPGLQLVLRIYDAEGREIRTLANNQSLGTEGFFTWNGTGEDGSRVRSGYYIVLLKVFDSTGYSQEFQKTIVVGNSF